MTRNPKYLTGLGLHESNIVQYGVFFVCELYDNISKAKLVNLINDLRNWNVSEASGPEHGYQSALPDAILTAAAVDHRQVMIFIIQMYR